MIPISKVIVVGHPLLQLYIQGMIVATLFENLQVRGVSID